MPLPPLYRVFITDPKKVWGSIGPHYASLAPALVHADRLNTRRTERMLAWGIHFTASEWQDPANLGEDDDDRALAWIESMITPIPERWKVIVMIGNYSKATINHYLTEIEAAGRTTRLMATRPDWAVEKQVGFRYEELDWPVGIRWYHGTDETLWQWIEWAVRDRERNVQH